MAFQYVARGGNLVCLEQNPLRGLMRARRRFMRDVGLTNALRVALHRWAGGCGFEPTLTLPVYGNACVRVQRGYMVFDLERGVATRVFRPRVSARHFRAQHEAFCTAGQLSFAPAVRDACPREQWFEMEYIDGENGRTCLVAKNDEQLMGIVLGGVLPCLVELSTSQPWQELALATYVRTLTRRLRAPQLARWPRIHRRMRDFCSRIRSELPKDGTVRLGLTHGDFVHPNLFSTPQGLRVVDWESAGYRSASQDLYSYFFSQLFWSQGMGRGKLDALERAFVTALGERAADFDPHVYRRLYYLERLVMVLGRDFGRAEAEHIDRSLSLFERFEAQCASSAQPAVAAL